MENTGLTSICCQCKLTVPKKKWLIIIQQLHWVNCWTCRKSKTILTPCGSLELLGKVSKGNRIPKPGYSCALHLYCTETDGALQKGAVRVYVGWACLYLTAGSESKCWMLLLAARNTSPTWLYQSRFLWAIRNFCWQCDSE